MMALNFSHSCYKRWVMQKSVLGLAYGLVVAGLLGLMPLIPGVGGPEVALAQSDIGVVGRYNTNATAPRRSVTLIQITNITNLLDPIQQVTCEIGVRWVSDDGATTCVIAPILISSGETKEFCSRAVDPTTLISSCSGGSCSGPPGSANQDIGTSNGVAYITISAASDAVPQCAENQFVDPRILYTEGDGDQTRVVAADNPKSLP
jgi:hypothetical protein